MIYFDLNVVRRLHNTTHYSPFVCGGRCNYENNLTVSLWPILVDRPAVPSNAVKHQTFKRPTSPIGGTNTVLSLPNGCTQPTYSESRARGWKCSLAPVATKTEEPGLVSDSHKQLCSEERHKHRSMGTYASWRGRRGRCSRPGRARWAAPGESPR